MKKLQLLTLTLVTGVFAASAQIVVTDADLEAGGTYTWSASNVYLLDGFVFLEDGGTLNIEPGTVIKGKETPSTGDLASTLIITQGATLIANGTETDPIIFTSELDDLSVANDLTYNDRALWGGLIILGNAQIGNATPTAAIEGIPTDDPRGTYGGDNDADNSGSLKYISIRHGGAEIGAGNEINGLTLGAVGSGTVIEHLEIYANLDDGIEFFGGTVNCKWIAVSFCGDDSFDWDQGYRGNGQFWFSLQDAATGDNGGELDGATPDGSTIYSNPTVYNATFIGSGSSAAAENATATLFRDATAGTFGNSIFTGFANNAIEVEDLPAASGVDSRQRMEAGELNLLNNVYYDFGSGDEFVAGELIRVTTDAEDADATFLVSHMTSNNNTVENPELTSVSRLPDGGLDPRPSVTGPAYTSALAAEPAAAFFSDVDYKGAFANGIPTWLEGWTALAANNHIVQAVNITQTQLSRLHVFPNPTDGMAMLSFSSDQSSQVDISLLDLQGRVILSISKGKEFPQGNNLVSVDLTNLPAGLYFIQFSTKYGQTQFVEIVK